MTYLEAQRLVDNFTGGEPLRFVLAMSGASDALDIFVRAAAARRQRAAEMRTLAFSTLGQRLMSSAKPDEIEVWLLTPWDFVPELDWRSGLPPAPLDATEIHRRAHDVAARLASRPNARLLCLPAAHLPLFADPGENAALSSALLSHAQALGACLLASNSFALGTYLASGCPVAGRNLADVAEAIVSLAASPATASRKLLVTDFDNVLWSGVVAEDGIDGIACGPQGAGFRHFLYQTLLVALRGEGVLIAGVSRNVEEDALAPIRAGSTLVGERDFVATLASYHSKSAQVRTLAERLNLAPDAVVFVDDNEVELAEVSAALPEVACLAFPRVDDGLPGFFVELRRLFARRVITPEDRERTELYRRGAAGLAPASGNGADLSGFLAELAMQLAIHDRTHGDRERAMQLINKANQFNINGRRVTEAELDHHLSRGGRLYTAALADRTGRHGEILSCLVSSDGIVESFVLSCRVFQRRVEHAFLSWLAQRAAPRAFRLVETPRNEPARRFFDDPSFRRVDGDLVVFDAMGFLERHGDDLALFGVAAA